MVPWEKQLLLNVLLYWHNLPLQNSFLQLDGETIVRLAYFHTFRIVKGTEDVFQVTFIFVRFLKKWKYFSRNFCPFSRNFRIFSRNRSQRNFANKAKIYAFFASERNTKICENFRETIFPFCCKPYTPTARPIKTNGYFRQTWFLPKKRNIFSSKYKMIENHYDYSVISA